MCETQQSSTMSSWVHGLHLMPRPPGGLCTWELSRWQWLAGSAQQAGVKDSVAELRAAALQTLKAPAASPEAARVTASPAPAAEQPSSHSSPASVPLEEPQTATAQPAVKKKVGYAFCTFQTHANASCKCRHVWAIGLRTSALDACCQQDSPFTTHGVCACPCEAALQTCGDLFLMLAGDQCVDAGAP